MSGFPPSPGQLPRNSTKRRACPRYARRVEGASGWFSLVYHLTQTNDITGDQAPRTQTYAEDTFLTIPKD